MDAGIVAYNASQPADARATCELLAAELTKGLPKSTQKVWHRHPVWFLNGNPIAGYATRKHGVTLLFWSGRSFDEPGLKPEGTFKAAEAVYAGVGDVNLPDLRRWLKKAAVIQWDYGNIVKRRGLLVRLDLPASPENTFLKVPESRRAGAKKKPVAKKPAEKPSKRAAPKEKPAAKQKR